MDRVFILMDDFNRTYITVVADVRSAVQYLLDNGEIDKTTEGWEKGNPNKYRLLSLIYGDKWQDIILGFDQYEFNRVFRGRFFLTEETLYQTKTSDKLYQLVYYFDVLTDPHYYGIFRTERGAKKYIDKLMREHPDLDRRNFNIDTLIFYDE